jgi:hypothetical protein
MIGPEIGDYIPYVLTVIDYVELYVCGQLSIASLSLPASRNSSNRITAQRTPLVVTRFYMYDCIKLCLRIVLHKRKMSGSVLYGVSRFRPGRL